MTAPIQYALESLPELLCASDYRLLCEAMGLHLIKLPHRDELRHQVQERISDLEKKTAEKEQTFRNHRQQGYERSLLPNEAGYFAWDGFRFPNGPSPEMFPALKDIPRDVVPPRILIDVEFADGYSITLDYQHIRWDRVKRWKVTTL